MKEGACQRNTYDAPCYPAGAEKAPRKEHSKEPEKQPGALPKDEPEFDYTRYFSRSRPDPEPETLS